MSQFFGVESDSENNILKLIADGNVQIVLCQNAITIDNNFRTTVPICFMPVMMIIMMAIEWK